MKTLTLAMIVLALPHMTFGQQTATNTLLVSGTAQSGPGLRGGEGGLEWLRSASSGSTAVAGAAATSFGDLWWSYGTLGGSTRRGVAIVSGHASIGGGRWNSAPFPFERLVGGAAFSLGHGVYGDAEAQHVRMAGTSATVVQFGTTYNAPSHTSVRLAYYTSPGSIAHERALSGRADIRVRTVTFMAGMVANTRQSASDNLRALDVTTHLAPEYFAGCALPVASSELITSLQIAPDSRGNLVRLTVGMKHALGDDARRQARAKP